MIPRPKRKTAYQKRRAEGERDQRYLAFIATHPCVVCGTRPVEVAHVGDRAFGLRCPDKETLPLCIQHHREDPYAQHRLGKRFWSVFALDRNALIAKYQALYAKQVARAGYLTAGMTSQTVAPAKKGLFDE